MTYVLHKGRPLTAQTVADLTAYFALVQRHQPIPKPLWARLHDAGVEAAAPAPKTPSKVIRLS